MSKDHIDVHNVIGPVNIKARLDHVKQTIKNASIADGQGKQQLSDLIEKLKRALEPAASKQPEDCQRVVEAAEMVANEVAKQKPSRKFLEITTEGLKAAAEAVKTITPAVLAIATQIATHVGTMFS